MSYNLDSVKTIKCDAWMTARDVTRLHREHTKNDDHRLPEVNFLAEMLAVAEILLEEGKPHAQVAMKYFSWSGEGSGYAYPEVLEQIVPYIHGRVEAVFTWAGGDSHSGIIIQDGVLTECDVKMALVPRGS